MTVQSAYKTARLIHIVWILCILWGSPSFIYRSLLVLVCHSNSPIKIVLICELIIDSILMIFVLFLTLYTFLLYIYSKNVGWVEHWSKWTSHLPPCSFQKGAIVIHLQFVRCTIIVSINQRFSVALIFVIFFTFAW